MRGAMNFLLAAVALLVLSCGNPASAPVDPVMSVSVSPVEDTLLPGETITLTAVPMNSRGDPLPGRTITWASENSDIAAVSDAGVLSAKAVGTVRVTATVENRSGSGRIRVAEPPAVPVAGVEIDPAAWDLELGGQVQLRAVLRDAEGGTLTGRVVDWIGHDHSVATVTENGLVTAVGTGIAQVSAVSEGKSARATINVLTPVPGPVETVELDRTTLALAEGDTTRLVATPRDAKGNVVPGLAIQWISSDPAAAAVDAAGKVTAIKTGSANIVAKVSGKTGTAVLSVTAEYSYDLVYRSWAMLQPPEIFRVDIRQPVPQPRRLFEGVVWITGVAFSPDGARVAYVVDRSGGRSSLYVARSDGSNPVHLTSAPGRNDQPAWSPDGSRIAFRRWDFEQFQAADILVIKPDGTGEVNLTSEMSLSSEHEPAWSPDGSRIVFSRNQGDGTLALWSMRADGGDKRQITEQHADVNPAWSPDGATIVFVRFSEGIFGDLYRISPAGGPATRLVDLPRGLFQPAFSPDGKLIAFATKHDDGVLQIHTVWADGSKLARRTWGTADHEEPAWVKR